MCNPVVCHLYNTCVYSPLVNYIIINSLIASVFFVLLIFYCLLQHVCEKGGISCGRKTFCRHSPPAAAAAAARQGCHVI